MTIDQLKAATAEVLTRLTIDREAESLGVKFAAAGPNSSGWRECYAVGREDGKPSAAIAVASQNGTLGMYTDLGTGEKLTFWDLAVRLQPARFRDWMAARLLCRAGRLKVAEGACGKRQF